MKQKKIFTIFRPLIYYIHLWHWSRFYPLYRCSDVLVSNASVIQSKEKKRIIRHSGICFKHLKMLTIFFYVRKKRKNRKNKWNLERNIAIFTHTVVIAFYLCLLMHVFMSVFSVTATLVCLHMLLLLYPIQSATSLSNQNSEQQACSITLSKHAWHSLSSWEYCYQWHGPEQEPYLIGKENIWSHSLASRLCNTWVDVYLLWIYSHAEMHNTTF